jgi:hypothetical protein
MARPRLSPSACSGWYSLGICSALLLPAALGAQQPPRFDVSLRPGYHAQWRTDRDGSASDVAELRTRIQTGVRWDPTAHVQLRGRIAGRFSTEQSDFDFILADHIPASDGLRLGQATVDELHLRIQPVDRVDLRVGRMQTVFELAGVPRKSLDRNDSPNTDVTWTDGAHLRIRTGAWNHHLIVQHNASAGPTNVIRHPLNFGDPGSRASGYLALEAAEPAGAIIQREIGLTYLPSTLPTSGGITGERRGYAAVTVRVAAELPLEAIGARVVLAGEGGFAPRTPDRILLATGAEGTGDGAAYQVSLNLMGAGGGRHSLGIVHGRVGDGWLISSDLRDNNREWEARYYWQYSSWGRLDLRFRVREDLYERVGAERTRLDRDLYLRTTLRF